MNRYTVIMFASGIVMAMLGLTIHFIHGTHPEITACYDHSRNEIYGVSCIKQIENSPYVLPLCIFGSILMLISLIYMLYDVVQQSTI